MSATKIEVEVRVRIFDQNGVEAAELARTEREPVDARGLEFWLDRAAATAIARVRDSVEQIAGQIERVEPPRTGAVREEEVVDCPRHTEHKVTRENGRTIGLDPKLNEWQPCAAPPVERIGYPCGCSSIGHRPPCWRAAK